MRQLSREFLECAKRRLSGPASENIEGELRRATSDLYFALFHAVCGALVEPIGFDPSTPGFPDVFKSLYRLPNHGFVEKRCKDAQHDETGFTGELQQFAKLLGAFKNKREEADYNPLAQMKLSTVRNDLQAVDTGLRDFWEANAQDRTRLAFFLSYKPR